MPLTLHSIAHFGRFVKSFFDFSKLFSTALSVGCPLDYIDSIAQNMGFVKMASCTKNRGKKMPELVIFHNSLPDHRPGSDKRPPLRRAGSFAKRKDYIYTWVFIDPRCFSALRRCRKHWGHRYHPSANLLALLHYRRTEWRYHH